MGKRASEKKKMRTRGHGGFREAQRRSALIRE